MFCEACRQTTVALPAELHLRPQEFTKLPKKFAILMPTACADEVSVNKNRLIHVVPTALCNVQGALGDCCGAATNQTSGRGRNFHSMTQHGNRFVGLKEVPGDVE